MDDSTLGIIRAKQQEKLAAQATANKLLEERKEAAKKAFIQTGIPAMWEQLKDIKVNPARIVDASKNNSSSELVPLHTHVKEITDTAIKLRDWDGERKAGWGVEVTDKGATWFVRYNRSNAEHQVYHTAKRLQYDFVEYMANFLPLLESEK